MFFRQDDIFGKPKATCQFLLVAPPAYESPTAAVLSDLFAKLVKVLPCLYDYSRRSLLLPRRTLVALFLDVMVLCRKL